MRPNEYLTRAAADDLPLDLDDALRHLGDHLPLLHRLADTEQDPEWHAEGDVATHTRMVIAELELQLAPNADILNARQRFIMRASALLHDIAKPLTTTRAVLHDGVEHVVAPRHAQRGASYLPLRLAQLGVPTADLLAIIALVRHHHDPKHLVIKDKPDASYHRLARAAWMRGLYWLEQADMRGRTCADRDEQITFIDLFGMRAQETNTWESAWDAGNPHLERTFCDPIRDALSSDPPSLVARAVAEGLWALDAGTIFTPEEAIARAYAMRERHTELVVLCGPSGSGKSSWAREHYPDHQVISMDALREAIAGDRADQSENGRVFQAAQEELKVALRALKPVVWDATCLRHDTRRKLLSLGRDYGAHTTLAAFLIPPDQLARRNRDRPHPVPPNILDRQIDAFEWPEPDEAHTQLVIDAAAR
jgi:predicted kinase